MTLGELKRKLGEAIRSGDYKTAGPILDQLTLRGWQAGSLRIEPFDARDLDAFAMDAVQAVDPGGLGLSKQAWDEFLYGLDEAASKGEA